MRGWPHPTVILQQLKESPHAEDPAEAPPITPDELLPCGFAHADSVRRYIDWYGNKVPGAQCVAKRSSASMLLTSNYWEFCTCPVQKGSKIS